MKAVCNKHGIAYERVEGCADCLAMERERYLATHDVDGEMQFTLSTNSLPELPNTIEEWAAAFEELKRKFPSCAHDVDPLWSACTKCGQPQYRLHYEVSVRIDSVAISLPFRSRIFPV